MDGTEFLAVSIVIGIMIGIPAVAYVYDTSITEIEEDVQVVKIMAWATENGGWTPDTIVVKKGVPVRLVITGRDVTHGLMIPELDVIIPPIAPGHTEEFEFTPTEVGTYSFKCYLFCSALHQEMTGTLIVEA